LLANLESADLAKASILITLRDAGGEIMQTKRTSHIFSKADGISKASG
jgi:hypothetical protein